MKIEIKNFDFESDRILSSLSSAERQLFISHTEELNFKRGKLIFYENGIPTGVFLIVSGRAKIYKTGQNGKDQIFYIYRSGELLGYHALLCNEVYMDSCEALVDCKMLFVSKSNFDILLKKSINLNQRLIQNMSHEFGVLVNSITILAQKNVRERLALYLLILEGKYIEENGDILLPREDLANIIGTVRESLGRLLKEFKEANLIEIENKIIRLKNHQKLLKIASSEYV